MFQVVQHVFFSIYIPYDDVLVKTMTKKIQVQGLMNSLTDDGYNFISNKYGYKICIFFYVIY